MKASRIIFIIAAIVVVLGSLTCGGSGCSQSKDKIDTLWNETVQNVFFDTPFGASRDEVIKNFAKHGFTLNRSVSNDTWLAFDYNKSDYYSFGGMTWENLNVFLTNGKFSSIEFYNPKKDKAEALDAYNGIVKELSGKYKLTTIEPEPGDTTVYGKKNAYSKSGCRAWVKCYRYESIGNEIFYTATLGYINDSIANEVSDEL